MNAYLFRSRHTGNPGLLIGTRAICRYGRISTATFYDWTRNHGLPAAKLPDGRWVTSKILIDDWVLSLWRQQQRPTVDDAPGEAVGQLEARMEGAAT
jgi:hypothetical protein